MDGDLSINKLVFMSTRAYKKDSASLISSGPRAHIHFWNVFQGGQLMAQFSGVCAQLPFLIIKITSITSTNKNDIENKKKTQFLRLDGS